MKSYIAFLVNGGRYIDVHRITEHVTKLRCLPPTKFSTSQTHTHTHTPPSNFGPFWMCLDVPGPGPLPLRLWSHHGTEAARCAAARNRPERV